MWTTARRLLAALAFGSGVAAVLVLVGTRDLESYEHVVFSLNRGTTAHAVSVAGQPVYTLALGLGVRLPLQGSLGASPAAALAPHLPVPFTYWLILGFAIAAAMLVLLHALEPPCGRLVAWVAAVLLFWSVPMVNYSVYDDWPEVAVTYCASIACVFAPHAMLDLLRASSTRIRRYVGALSVAGTIWALLALSHPGYWPQLASTLLIAGVLALCRSDHLLRTRLAVVAALGLVSLTAVALPSVDLLRDFNATRAGGDMDRAIGPFSASVLASNLFPFPDLGARLPFSYLFLAVVSVPVGLASPHTHTRVMILGAALASVAFVFGAMALSTREAVSAFEPSSIWTLRDPAGGFAVLSGAWAAATCRSLTLQRSAALRWGIASLLAIFALQGPAYATILLMRELGNEQSWTRDITPLEERASQRGLAPERVPPGQRLALWPNVRQSMRSTRRPSTDFADAGYLLVTAWTKQRTMRGLIDNNSVLFNQSIEPSSEVLCDIQAVRFLQLRYLLRPSEVDACAPWSPLPDMRVDDDLAVDMAGAIDNRIHALPIERLADRSIREPALSDDSAIVTTLVPLPGTSLLIQPPSVVLQFDDPTVASGQALVLPVAHDEAWRSSSGDVRDVGGLLALVGVAERQVTLRFVPDLAAVLRALSMTLAQVLAVGGMLGLAYLGPRKSVVGTAAG